MKLTEVFFVSTRVMYPVEIKEEAIKMKLASKTTEEIMNTLNTKNPVQVKIWWRQYRNGASTPSVSSLAFPCQCSFRC